MTKSSQFYGLLSETPDFLIVNKFPLVLTVPPRFSDNRPVLGRILEQDFSCQIFPVHRLDYEVSGVMLFAKNREAHRAANVLFEKHLIRKTYSAWTEFSEQFTEKSSWISERRILRGKKRSYESPHGDLAITEIFYQGPSYSEGRGFQSLMWTLNPRTGRSHQLRLEMALLGVPIHGDTLYGSTQPWKEGGIALRAVALDLPSEFSAQFQLPLRLEITHQLQD